MNFSPFIFKTVACTRTIEPTPKRAKQDWNMLDIHQKCYSPEVKEVFDEDGEGEEFCKALENTCKALEKNPKSSDDFTTIGAGYDLLKTFVGRSNETPENPAVIWLQEVALNCHEAIKDRINTLQSKTLESTILTKLHEALNNPNADATRMSLGIVAAHMIGLYDRMIDLNTECMDIDRPQDLAWARPLLDPLFGRYTPALLLGGKWDDSLIKKIESIEEFYRDFLVEEDQSEKNIFELFQKAVKLAKFLQEFETADFKEKLRGFSTFFEHITSELDEKEIILDHLFSAMLAIKRGSAGEMPDLKGVESVSALKVFFERNPDQQACLQVVLSLETRLTDLMSQRYEAEKANLPIQFQEGMTAFLTTCQHPYNPSQLTFMMEVWKVLDVVQTVPAQARACIHRYHRFDSFARAVDSLNNPELTSLFQKYMTSLTEASPHTWTIDGQNYVVEVPTKTWPNNLLNAFGIKFQNHYTAVTEDVKRYKAFLSDPEASTPDNAMLIALQNNDQVIIVNNQGEIIIDTRSGGNQSAQTKVILFEEGQFFRLSPIDTPTVATIDDCMSQLAGMVLTDETSTQLVGKYLMTMANGFQVYKDNPEYTALCDIKLANFSEYLLTHLALKFSSEGLDGYSVLSALLTEKDSLQLTTEESLKVSLGLWGLFKFMTKIVRSSQENIAILKEPIDLMLSKMDAESAKALSERCQTMIAMLIAESNSPVVLGIDFAEGESKDTVQYTVQDHPELRLVQKHPTTGDGNCGMHALLTPADSVGRYHLPTGDQARIRFFEALNTIEGHRFEAEINMILKDHCATEVFRQIGTKAEENLMSFYHKKQESGDVSLGELMRCARDSREMLSLAEDAFEERRQGASMEVIHVILNISVDKDPTLFNELYQELRNHTTSENKFLDSDALKAKLQRATPKERERVVKNCLDALIQICQKHDPNMTPISKKYQQARIDLAEIEAGIKDTFIQQWLPFYLEHMKDKTRYLGVYEMQMMALYYEIPMLIITEAGMPIADTRRYFENDHPPKETVYIVHSPGHYSRVLPQQP